MQVRPLSRQRGQRPVSDNWESGKQRYSFTVAGPGIQRLIFTRTVITLALLLPQVLCLPMSSPQICGERCWSPELTPADIIWRTQYSCCVPIRTIRTTSLTILLLRYLTLSISLMLYTFRVSPVCNAALQGEPGGALEEIFEKYPF